MRDTDIGWMTKIVALADGLVSTISDLKERTLALASRDSGHAAVLPVHFLQQQGIQEGRDYRTLRFDSDVGKHGDTGTSEAEVIRAVLDRRADAGAIGSPFWNAVRSDRLAPEGSLREVWSSPAFNHCMFTARPDFDPEQERQFAQALLAMSYENPVHRPILDAEGLHRWVAPQLDGYADLGQAASQQGLLRLKKLASKT
jgi:ABC-type phosphate/phosphonate transport system substrate-binding protein